MRERERERGNERERERVREGCRVSTEQQFPAWLSSW